MRIPDHSVTGDGPVTIYLFHGAYGSKEYWKFMIARLVRRGFRVVAWDAPGYGLSPLPDTVIHGSFHNPKILWIDDTKIVGYRTSEQRPVSRDLFAQKSQRCICELGACRVGLVVRDIPVHDAPQSLYRV